MMSHSSIYKKIRVNRALNSKIMKIIWVTNNHETDSSIKKRIKINKWINSIYF